MDACAIQGHQNCRQKYVHSVYDVCSPAHPPSIVNRGAPAFFAFLLSFFFVLICIVFVVQYKRLAPRRIVWCILTRLNVPGAYVKCLVSRCKVLTVSCRSSCRVCLRCRSAWGKDSLGTSSLACRPERCVVYESCGWGFYERSFMNGPGVRDQAASCMHGDWMRRYAGVLEVYLQEYDVQC